MTTQLLHALTDGEEVRVDLGMIADRPFVNNASFGAYAEIGVQHPPAMTVLAVTGSRWKLRPGPRVLAMTDSVAELNQVKIAMLCALTAGLQVRPPRRGRHPEPEAQNRIDLAGELK